ncbi:ketoacyl-ACP synthase III family protein [Actinomadura sp. CNU-125]|uniref:ketoacyl-ACP synthase III family protein n=1 Tax=Actinomadura sp. CNU-125 TaxID=1904961 RepID=UPI0021CCACC5|nr:ketoacyl-ACP synthase III family protein [Actinomadura sp. CNU-125]
MSTESAVAQGLYDADELDLHGITSVAVAGREPAPEMARRAAGQALARCGHEAPDLDLLLYATTWHQGPEGWLPHSYLQRHLVGDGVPATEIRQGCNGMFTAMRLASSHLRAEPGGNAALLVASDNYGTPLVNRWDMGRGYIAGDAATAMLLTREPGFAELLSVCSATVSSAEEMHRGDEDLFPPGITLGRGLDFGARNAEYLRRARNRPLGTTALLEIQRRTLEVVDTALAESGISIADVTRVAFMNVSKEIVEQRCMAALGLPMSRSTWDFGATVGHCGASDQVLALDHLLSAGGLHPGDHLLMLGTGPGVLLSGAVVRILDTPSWLNRT